METAEPIRSDAFRLRDGTEFKLELYEPVNLGMGRWQLSYRLYRNDQVLFEGDDYGCSPMHAVDGVLTMLTLLSFLTLPLGATDREYFDGYTDNQIAFRDNEAVELFMVAIDTHPEYGNNFGYDLVVDEPEPALYL